MHVSNGPGIMRDSVPNATDSQMSGCHGPIQQMEHLQAMAAVAVAVAVAAAAALAVIMAHKPCV